MEVNDVHEQVAVCPIVGVSIGTVENKATWRIDFKPEATAQQKTAAQGVIDAFVVAPTPPRIELSTLQKRIEAEGAWDTYVNYMFAVAGRRNAFLKIVMRGQPIANNDANFIASLQGAGLLQAQISRIVA